MLRRFVSHNVAKSFLIVLGTVLYYGILEQGRPDGCLADLSMALEIFLRTLKVLVKSR